MIAHPVQDGDADGRFGLLAGQRAGMKLAVDDAFASASPGARARHGSGGESPAGRPTDPGEFAEEHVYATPHERQARASLHQHPLNRSDLTIAVCRMERVKAAVPAP